MPDFTVTSSVAGSPGTFNSALYPASPFGHIAGSSLDSNPIGTGTGVLPAGQQHMNAGLFEQGLIRNARGKLMYANPAWIKQSTIPKGNRPRSVMFKVSEINVNEASPDTYKLVEGTTPDQDHSLTVETIEITAQQYGVVMYFSDIVESVTYFQFKATVVERLGWALGRIIDSIVKLHYAATVPDDSAIYTGKEGAGNLSWLRLLRLRALLEKNEVEPPASEGEFFPMIIHTNQIADLLRDTDIRNAIEHSNVGWDAAKNPMVHPARFGEAAGFRFYKTTRCMTYDGPDTDVLPDGFVNLVVGRDLIASTSMADPQVGTGPNLGAAHMVGGGISHADATSPVTIIEKGLGSAGTADPFNQQQSIAAKWTFGLRIIQPLAGSQIKSTSDYAI